MRPDLKPIGEVMRLLGVSRSTLWEWERWGIVTPYRDYRRHRYYDAEQIAELQRRLEPRKPEEV